MENGKKKSSSKTKLFAIVGGVIAALCLCIVVIAIASPSEESASSPTAIPETNQIEPTQVVLPEPTATESKSSRCVPASNPQLEAIRLGVKGISQQNDIKTGWTVKSSDYENAWFVAAKIYGPGIESGTEPGLWIVSGDPENPSSGAFSVNGFAKEFSDRGTGETLGLNFSMFDDGAQEAIECASND